MKTIDVLLILATIIISVIGVYWGLKALKDEREKSIGNFIKQREKNENRITYGKEN